MGKYLHKFESVSDFNTAYNGNAYIEPWVSCTVIANTQSFTAKLKDGNEIEGPYDFVLQEVVDFVTPAF